MSRAPPASPNADPGAPTLQLSALEIHEFRGDIPGPNQHVAGLVSLLVFYVVVVTLGILSMGFQLLASRLLSPYFGSAIDVWACLISTFLAAFSAGAMLGGWVSSLPTAPRRRWQVGWAVLAVATLGATAVFGRAMVDRIALAFEPGITPVLLASIALFFFPVTALSSFTPQCVQFLASRGTAPGKASGVVYGVSTMGNIAGVMLTAFVLIPHFRVSTLFQIWVAVAIVSLGGLLRLLRVSPSV